MSAGNYCFNLPGTGCQPRLPLSGRHRDLMVSGLPGGHRGLRGDVPGPRVGRRCVARRGRAVHRNRCRVRQLVADE
eukprot:scaffold656052_cov106-Prasinocladus_malaysianus.AAC.1